LCGLQCTKTSKCASSSHPLAHRLSFRHFFSRAAKYICFPICNRHKTVNSTQSESISLMDPSRSKLFSSILESGPVSNYCRDRQSEGSFKITNPFGLSLCIAYSKKEQCLQIAYFTLKLRKYILNNF
jgi:hypothetical protein